MRPIALFASSLALVACTVGPSSSKVDSMEGELATYRVDLTGSSPVTVGSTAQLAIRVFGAGDVPVTRFDDLHTQVMHVVGVSSDLQGFIHVHPTLGDDGTLRVGAPIAKSQPYQFFFEYDPAGPAGEHTNRATLSPEGAVSVLPALAGEAAFDGHAQLSSSADATRIELSALAHGMLMSDMDVTLRIVVKTSSGDPATDLVDWLGMPGHAIVLSEDTSTFIHAHAMHPGNGGHGGHGSPMDAGPPVRNNVLDIDLKLPKSGLYKMFVQVKRGENVVTAPFVLKAVAM